MYFHTLKRRPIMDWPTFQSVFNYILGSIERVNRLKNSFIVYILKMYCPEARGVTGKQQKAKVVTRKNTEYINCIEVPLNIRSNIDKLITIPSSATTFQHSRPIIETSHQLLQQHFNSKGVRAPINTHTAVIESQCFAH